ncbi:uncharacterized protein LOC132257965 [Phlebotomus argentipes]|uniref:uncharacterized protein LOC132257965 n=1 Tax=Phlebotomus argentipes TaxID=94469 RepID=UPI002892CC3B|nr:uncharacterized protein LOC132257965 [Phlebotomus argentipes]
MNKKSPEKAPAIVWDKKKTLQLISKYNASPILWDPNCKTYRNRELKTKAFDELAKSMKMSRKEVQRKLHNLRTQYNTEVRKLQKTGKASEVKWEFFDAIKFINVSSRIFDDKCSDQSLDLNTSFSSIEFKDVNSVTPSSGIFRNEEEASRDPTMQFNGYEDPTPRASFRSADVLDDHPTSKSNASLDTSRDDHQIFGDFVGSELRSLSSDFKRKKLRLAIQRAILDVNELP